ncbi:hypothetical protein MUK71_09505 [Arthrobacter zhangbolii]|uniref:Uncharacterized protein n=1 Tax=Arthrobacter zhangbolii TaxID=2886936 RepID=A0A9X1M5N4_9MICC|nr:MULTISPECIES: hypothetical protein [Arthrobacter]MCC3271340.1 hypothetical protein [Arthrobacter zhangbolii]MDN3904411.1 hypothetical protein [Arthrobacter sp. YD2]UON90877.1 hypothetical protein MUK71_09505 [Arthrobacter zhangbolii]
MNTTREYRPAFFIIGAALLGALAVILTPGLFENFGSVRLVTVLVLTAGALCFAVAASRSRRMGPGTGTD